MLRIIREHEADAICGLKSTRRRELERAGKFPQRIRVGERATGYRSDELEDWIKSRPRAADIPVDVDVSAHATTESRALGSEIRTEIARARVAGEEISKEEARRRVMVRQEQQDAEAVT